MSRYLQKGVTTLAVTSILLMVALTVTLGSQKSLFYQIKRSQNEIKSRQNHWLAEGAIECGYAQFRAENKVPQNITDCGSGHGVIASFVPSIYGQRVVAQSGYSTVEKEIQIKNRLSSGAIQSNADLYFHSSLSFATPDPGKLTERGWECVALRYGSRFYSPSLVNQGVVHGRKPYEDFSNPGYKDCLGSHRSFGQSWGHLGKDFVQDAHLSLFEQFFNVPAHEHDKVKMSDKVTVMEGVGYPKQVYNCGSALASQIRSGKHFLWVEGGCEIKMSEYNNLVNAASATDGVLILVHEGVFSVMGKPPGGSSEPFKGVLFHFNREFVASPIQWRGFVADRILNHPTSVIERSFRNIASYYQYGAFSLSGGQYFDTPGQAAVFNDSLEVNFNGDVINNVQANVNPPRWREGSWYAE